MEASESKIFIWFFIFSISSMFDFESFKIFRRQFPRYFLFDRIRVKTLVLGQSFIQPI